MAEAAPPSASAAAANIVVVAGPTGSGKSALAVALAEAFGGSVINADSMQVYREARVLTARPGPADEARAPHRLFGVLAAADRCSAGRWLEMAEAEILAARVEGLLPVVVGGTGLYLEALLNGLAPVPAVPPEVRREAERLHGGLGGKRFRAMLIARDPASAKLHEGDRQRLLRAWEVLAATGTPLAEWQQRQGARDARARSAAVILLLPPREDLYPALEARFERMLEDGGLEEARALHALDLDPALPLLRAVGIRELLDHVAGKTGFAEASALAKQATRRYAKRQMTWFRHRLDADLRIDEQFSESLRPKIFSFIRQRLLTRRR
ncbi:MAG: tRNA (adenosine(37)-N6)-dimethylallyltransferase MiaA [Rhodospirillales bacterium]|nr:tRNA (adenosine(37)-N6)-dimethylallyltransferase MiaA [Rhodospirillales bacterium]